MRTILRNCGTPDCVSLAYDAWAPVGADGKVPDGERPGWLSRVADIPVTPHYRAAFERWRSSFNRAGDRTVEVELAGRLLVGHGGSSATDVGLTTHHTWGVPIIPGTALKGVVAHHLDAVYGPDDLGPAPWERTGEDRERSRYQGVLWSGSRPLRGPGDMHRALFGAPETDQDDISRRHGLAAGATRGAVVFHDALYVPRSQPDDRPFAVDVLTVHQKAYYDGAGTVFPSDHDDPNPVGFITARPGVRFLLALSGAAEWTERAERLLLDALAEWGVGAKTSAGYGRIVRPGGDSEPGSVRAVAGPRHRRGARITVTRVADPKGWERPWFQADDGFAGHFADGQAPAIDHGQVAEVWVANVSVNGYTLTLKRPKGAGGERGRRR